MVKPAERLRQRIGRQGALSFAEFMNEALYGEEGYYRRPRLPIGREGDFITGASWSPLFGRTTARLVRRLDEVLAAPADFLEVGPGNGEHLETLVAALGGRLPGRRIYACDRVERVWPEPVRFVGSMAELPALRGLVFSYELFDAMPVHRVIAGPDGSLAELGVELENGAFAWRRMELSDPRLESWLVAAGVELVPGQIADVSLDWEPCYRGLARALEQGLLVTCDYGFESGQLFDQRVRRHGTLACYRAQRVHRDALRDAGEQDLTAHVDFSLLRRVGEEEGLSTICLLRQGVFLARAGLFDELAASPEAAPDARRLLDGEGMGDAIRVLVQTRRELGRIDSIRIFEDLFNPSNGFSKTYLG